MKRIIVEKNEAPSAVARKMLGTMEREVVLVIPKGSRVGSSLNNLHLLHKEAQKARKQLSVESVDEEVLAFAKLAGIASSHPFLGRRSGLQDIVPRAEGGGRGASRRSRASKEEPLPLRVSEEEEAFAEADEGEEREDDAAIAKVPMRAPRRHGVSLGRLKGVVIAILLLLGIGGGIWAVGAFFGTATVTVRLEEVPWNYEGVFIADTAAVKADPLQKVIPAELFSLNRNITQPIPATGTEEVKEYARGTLTIYNSFSSTPQLLVATTRFATPEGKIFRLADRVTVPGAVVRGGAITPASTTATVVADKPGAEYNVGPVAKLTVPAFRGSPRFDGFYGVLAGGAKGGYVGTKKIPTAKDIEAGKAKTTGLLKTALEGLLAATKPEGFMVADGGMAFEMKRITVSTSTDTSGNFNVFGEATLAALGFREADVRALLLGYAAADRNGKGLEFRSLALDAKAGALDAARRRGTVNVAARGVLTAAFNPEAFKASVMGRSVREARAAIGRIQGLAEGKISLWPLWLQSVPSEGGRIKIVVQ
jgi:hypothetical protein